MLKPIYLIDASIYIFRGWHLFSHALQDASGQPINAVHGFADFLLELFERQSIEHIACAFDITQGQCARRQLYPDYKANRQPAPDELRRQFALCRELVTTLGIPSFSSALYEADDIIGTFASQFRQQGCRSIILTADKDLTQLVGPQDEWWDYGRKIRLSRSGVKKRFNVEPEQIPDLLALMGDKADNIPGVPSIGRSTAARLLIKWGDIDGIYANLARVREMKFRGAARVQELLAEHEPMVRLARRLTGMFMDDELPTDLQALQPKPVDREAVRELFARLNIKSYQEERWLRVLQAA